jgi:hypothetical protein
MGLVGILWGGGRVGGGHVPRTAAGGGMAGGMDWGRGCGFGNGLELGVGTVRILPPRVRKPEAIALLAQLVEQLTLNQRVEGSSPSGGILATCRATLRRSS